MKIDIKKTLILLWTMLVLMPVIASGSSMDTVQEGFKGIVTDESNIPLRNVIVSVQEKALQAVSDAEGRFVINILPGDVIILEKKGYEQLNVKVGAIEETETFVMKQYDLFDDELINVAYATQTRRNIVSAVSTVSGKELEKNGVARVDDALNGIIPGLYTLQSSGYRFGLNNYNLLVRGKATNGDATPLILVDGMEADISLIDYLDVESISVLKDATALAMYGMRGANGVILITTKGGSAKGSSIQFEIKAGVQTPVHIADRLNAYQYTTLYNEALRNDGQNAIYNPDAYTGQRNEYLYPDVDFKDMFLKSATPYQHYQVSSNGGNNIAQYYLSLGYLKQEGLFKNGKNNSYERFNLRTAIDVNLRKGLTFGFKAFASLDNNKVPYTGEYSAAAINNVFSKIITLPANAYPLFNADGSLGGTSTYQDNVYGMLNRSGTRKDNSRVLNTLINARQELAGVLSGLSIEAFFGLENYNRQYATTHHEYAVYDLQSDGTYIQYGNDESRDIRTNALIDKNYYRYTTFGAALDYNRKFAKKHNVGAKLILSQETRTLSGDYPDTKYINLAFRGVYGYQNKYFGEVTGSYQGSNSYMSGHRFGIFPAVGAAWIVSEENFLKNNPVISFAKIRATYGVNGNDNRNNKDNYYDARFPYRQTWSITGGYGFGNPNANSTGASEGILGNPETSWEKSYKMNVGFDINLLKDLSLSFDYFNEDRKDILVNYSNVVPSLIGVDMPQYNGGDINNRGIEVSLAYHKEIGKWNIWAAGNLLWAKSKIIDIKEIAYQYDHMYRKGHPVGVIFGYQTNGIYTTPEQLENAPSTQFGQPQLGDIIYVNQNPEDDNLINTEDQVAIGNSLPEIIYGVTLGAGYNGFDLSVIMEGSGNYDVLFRPDQFSTYGYENRWNPSTPTVVTSYPRASIASNYNQQSSDFWLDNGRALNISSIELGYTFPKTMMKKIRVTNMRIYINGNNIYKFTKMKDNRDNEAVSAGYSQFPLLRTWSVGLSVKL